MFYWKLWSWWLLSCDDIAHADFLLPYASIYLLPLIRSRENRTFQACFSPGGMLRCSQAKWDVWFPWCVPEKFTPGSSPSLLPPQKHPCRTVCTLSSSISICKAEPNHITKKTRSLWHHPFKNHGSWPQVAWLVNQQLCLYKDDSLLMFIWLLLLIVSRRNSVAFLSYGRMDSMQHE